jgi:hypothetical protein
MLRADGEELGDYITGDVVGRGVTAARVAREFDLGLFISEASPRNFAIALSLQLGRTIMRCRGPVYPHMTESGVS